MLGSDTPFTPFLWLPLEILLEPLFLRRTLIPSPHPSDRQPLPLVSVVLMFLLGQVVQGKGEFFGLFVDSCPSSLPVLHGNGFAFKELLSVTKKIP